MIQNFNFEKILEIVKKGEIAEPYLIRLDLSEARKNLEINLSGNLFYIFNSSSQTAKIKVKFNRIDAKETEIIRGIGWIRPFNKIFISNEAQSGEWVEIFISFYAPALFQLLDNRSEILQSQYLENIQNYTKGIVDDTIKGLLRSIGDVGASPSNSSGRTVLNLLDLIDTKVRSLNPNEGTPINKSSNAGASTTNIIHTVTAGKSFCLSSCFLGGQGNTDFEVLLYVRDASDIAQYRLLVIRNAVAGGQFIARSFPHPVRIPAGYDIVLQTNAAATNVDAGISGWEE
jgi:hypothetical protein